MERRDAGRKVGIEFEVAAELAERIVGRLERKHAAGSADETRQRQGMGADIGADIEHQRSRPHQPAQGGSGLPFIDIGEVDRKIYSLRKVEIVRNAVPPDDLAIGSAEQGASGMNGVINRSRGCNLVGRLHQIIPLTAGSEGRYS